MVFRYVVGGTDIGGRGGIWRVEALSGFASSLRPAWWMGIRGKKVLSAASPDFLSFLQTPVE